MIHDIGRRSDCVVTFDLITCRSTWCSQFGTRDGCESRAMDSRGGYQRRLPVQFLVVQMLSARLRSRLSCICRKKAYELACTRRLAPSEDRHSIKCLASHERKRGEAGLKSWGKAARRHEHFKGMSIMLTKRRQRPTKQVYYCSYRTMQWKQVMHLGFQMSVSDVGCPPSGNGE